MIDSDCERLLHELKSLVLQLQNQHPGAQAPVQTPPAGAQALPEDIRLTYVQGLARFNAQLNEAAADKIQAAAERNADRWQLQFGRLAGIPASLPAAAG